jgi:hypothetical protein
MFPDGYNCELPLGENNANNAQDTSLVVANKDGSVLERQEYVQEIIGLPTDFPNGNSTVFAFGNAGYQHIHQPAKCYPTLADGVTVTGGAGAWTLGDFVEIVPVDTITTAFDIHWINFESASANDIYELVLYSGLGGAEVEIARVRTYKSATMSGANNVPIQIPVQYANTRISAKLASSSGGDNVTVSLFYHQYS